MNKLGGMLCETCKNLNQVFAGNEIHCLKIHITHPRAVTCNKYSKLVQVQGQAIKNQCRANGGL